jgi:hypothetical protein
MPSQILGCVLIGAEVPGAAWMVFGLALYAWGASRRRPRLWMLALAGVCFGIGALIRPQVLLVAAVAAAHLLYVSRRRWLRALPAAAVLGAATLATVAPWTIRNYHVTGGFILISSNGGGNLYSANNPEAKGKYTESAWVYLFVRLETYLELQRIGTRCALAWIRANPGAFAKLSLRKLLIFWCSDGDIAWWAAGHCGWGDGSEPAYWAMGLSNGFYLAMMAAAVAALWVHRRSLRASRMWQLVPLVAAYYTVVHMVFESQDKYHFVLMGVLVLLAALWIWPPRLVQQEVTEPPASALSVSESGDRQPS